MYSKKMKEAGSIRPRYLPPAVTKMTASMMKRMDVCRPGSIILVKNNETDEKYRFARCVSVLDGKVFLF